MSYYDYYNVNEQDDKIQLSDHFSYSRLVRFATPSIIMMICTTIFGVIDGFFISNFVGKTAFASINLILPFLQIIGSMGVILGADGSALIARALGSGDKDRAGRYFTMTMIATLLGGLLFTVVGLVMLRPMAYLLGATEEMIGDCVTYGSICLLFNLFYLAQRVLQEYLVVAEKPRLALKIMLIAGAANIVLDLIFVHPAFLNMGVSGAAISTGICEVLAAAIPFAWFVSRRNKTAIRFRQTRVEWNTLRRAGITGSSDTISAMSASVIGMLYNMQLMHYAGENGVAAYGVVMYASFIFTAIFSGYSVGTAPIMGYHYGAGNQSEMRNVFKKSITMLSVAAAAMVVLISLLARPFSAIFVGYDWKLLDLTTRAFIICMLPYLMMWFNTYLSTVFTALDKGPMAAALTACRVIIFPVVCIIVMPLLWELDGVWFALTGAELLGVIVIGLAFFTQKRKFGY
ncbi:MAG: MATE family efflux transporter [Ruminococcaceae bacterium]|nr:MATE family efflux transporter [Oscillospiraceae bacterium]